MRDTDDAIGELYYRWNTYTKTTGMLDQAKALVELNNAINDVFSYHSAHNYVTGEISGIYED